MTHVTSTISVSSAVVAPTTNNNSKTTLVLDQSYLPSRVISWQRALTLVLLDKAEIVESYESYVKSPTYSIQVPAVIRLIKSYKRVRKQIKFSRHNVYARDNGKCAFCGKKFDISQMTYDHVIPKAQGGTTVWTNIVSSCPKCNSRKGNRTPEQAGMKLLWKPVQPTWLPSVGGVRITKCPKEWEAWLDVVGVASGVKHN